MIFAQIWPGRLPSVFLKPAASAHMHLLRPLVMQYVLCPMQCSNCDLQAKDLQAWSENAEAFHHECESSAWEEHLRSCAQVLLGVLMEVRSSQCCLAPAVGT